MKLNPLAWAWFENDTEVPVGYQYVTESMILDHVLVVELPKESAIPFAAWADDVWTEYNDGSESQTNGEIIQGMLAYWRGQ